MSRINRHDFIAMGAAVAAAMRAGSGFGAPAKDGQIVKRDAPPRNRRPYSGLDWSTVKRVKTTSHGHRTSQAMLDVYLKRGFELLTMSNYYPSAPYVPASKMTRNYWVTHHDFPVMVNGRRTEGPFDWNAIVAGWKGELDPKIAKRLPLKEGEKLFKPIPEGVLEAPNAEHHGFKWENGKWANNVHMCAPGSAFKSGTFDAHSVYKTVSHGYYFGSGELWETAVDRMIDALVCPDGGGVTINHPTWTKLSRDRLAKMLDYDPRVLGIEVLECCGVNSENYWDWVLATGRQCFGFFVPDWGAGKEVKGGIDRKRDFGVNVLCVEEKTVEACLKAYRQGNFYGAAHGLDELAFTRIAFDGKTVSAQTDRPALMEVVTARGVVKSEKGTSIEWDVVPNGHCAGPHVDVFARVRAKSVDGSDEKLFSQPMMLV